MAAGDLLDAFAEAAGDIDRGVGSIVGGDHRQLGVRGRGRDHPRAQHLGQVDGGQSHTAGGAVHQHPLAGLKPRAADQGHVGRDVGRAVSGRLAERQALGLQTQARRRGDGELGHAADHRASDHRVADPEPIDALAQRFDLAGDLQAGDERQGRLVLVFATGLQKVGEIHRGRAHAHADLARPRLGRRDLLQNAARVVRSEGFHHQGAHQSIFPSNPRRTRTAISRQAASAAGTAPVKAMKPCARLSWRR